MGKIKLLSLNNLADLTLGQHLPTMRQVGLFIEEYVNSYGSFVDVRPGKINYISSNPTLPS